MYDFLLAVVLAAVVLAVVVVVVVSVKVLAVAVVSSIAECASVMESLKSRLTESESRASQLEEQCEAITSCPCSHTFPHTSVVCTCSSGAVGRDTET